MNKNSEELDRIMSFPVHEAGIRVELGVNAMMRIDSIQDSDADDRKVNLMRVMQEERAISMESN